MNLWYGKGVKHFAEKNLAFLSDTIIAMLVTGAYAPDLDNDEFISDIPSTAIVSRSTLSGKTDTLGVLNCSTVTWTLVPNGNLIPYVVLAHSTGTDSTSELLVKYDVAQGLPVRSIGGDIAMQIDTGPNKLATL